MSSKGTPANLDNDKNKAKRAATTEAKRNLSDLDDEFYKLNPRQRKFIEAYLLSGDAKNSARAAGYSQHTAGAIGKVMTDNPRLKAIIDHKRKEASNVARISKEKMLISLENARLKAEQDGDINTLVKMTAEIAKLQGYYEREDKAALDVLKMGKIKITFGDKSFNPNKKIKNKINPFEDETGKEDGWNYDLDNDEDIATNEEEEDYT